MLDAGVYGVIFPFTTTPLLARLAGVDASAVILDGSAARDQVTAAIVATVQARLASGAAP